MPHASDGELAFALADAVRCGVDIPEEIWNRVSRHRRGAFTLYCRLVTAAPVNLPRDAWMAERLRRIAVPQIRRKKKTSWIKAIMALIPGRRSN